MIKQNNYIASHMQNIDSSGIRKVFDLSKNLTNPINLSIGEPDFDVPDLLKEYAYDAIRSGQNKYTLTGGMPKLKDKLLNHIAKTKSANCDDIIITSGVSGALFLALFVMLNKGDEVLIPDPYFVSYKHLVNVLGAKAIYLDTYPNFALSKHLLEKSISPKTKLLILNSPANPTGKVYTKKELDLIASFSKKHNLFILSDEIYEDFTYDSKHISIASMYKNTLIMSGYSKSLAMTGWRLGYAAGPKEIIQEMTKLQQYTFVCAPSVAQNVLMKSLDYNNKHQIEAYKTKRNIIYDGLKSLILNKPNGAFYAFLKIPDHFESDYEFFNAALKQNLLLIPGSVFSEQNKHIRISFANDNEALKRGVEIINSLQNKDIRA